MGPRRLSQAISEGEGISLLARVDDPGSASAAEVDGADGLVVGDGVPEVRAAASLPILCRAAQWADEADAIVLVVSRLDVDEGELEQLYARAHDVGLEPVVEVHDEEELQSALELIDPEIFLLSGAGADDDEEPLDRVLALLPDVPAGKLAIAEVPLTSREEVLALERAGMDAVLVEGADVAELAGGAAAPHV